jgi:hypothetical protein
MIMRFKGLLSTLGLMALLGTGTASAGALLDPILDYSCQQNPTAPGCAERTPGATNGAAAVPEIDATSGTQAIALAIGLLLLGAERLRRRSSETK